MLQRDPSLDALLELHGQSYALTEDLAYWVDFRVVRVPLSQARPHGLDYALNLHGPDSGKPRDSRLIGFDNAHAVASSGPAKRAAWDHKHRLRTVQPYEYSDAGRLVEDFWTAVAQMLRERGINL
ncbi:DUF6516 family protein [Methylobacterium hispanicum]|uniref:DUF6516 family protein n=1 Tax=Methylobacterium hispanicum TaxID=270350 RepID=UPI002F30A1BA